MSNRTNPWLVSITPIFEKALILWNLPLAKVLGGYKPNSNFLCSSVIFILITSITPTTAQPQTNQQITPHNNPYQQTFATILYVDDDNTNGPWDGSLNHPYQYIQDAIKHAQPYDHIYVFNGTYYEHLHIYKPLTIEGESNQHTIIDGGYISNIITITSQNTTLARFTIQNSGITTSDTAILIDNQHTIILENNIQHNQHGIKLNTPNNAIIYNNFKNNKNHAYTQYNNTITYNHWDNIHLNDINEDGIGDNPYPIPGNNITDPFPLIHQYGSIINQNTTEIFFSIQSAIDAPTTHPHNTITVQPDIYQEHLTIHKPITLQGLSQTTTIIDGRKQHTIIHLQANHTTITKLTIQNSGTNQTDTGIHITGNDNTISKTTLTQNYIGIKLSQSKNTYLTQNNFSQNSWIGVIINHQSHNTTIYHNIFISNGYAGIGINTSSDNKIYHNDFINHLHNAYDDSHNTWDNNFPSGGNYWNDYIGIDNFQGPQQDIPGSDGIGDTPYQIKGGINQDCYPLMYPQVPYDTTPPTVTITRPTNGLYIREHHLLSQLLQKTIIIGKITIRAQANDDESGITQVKFYLNNEPSPVYTGYEPPYHWHWSKRTLLPNIHQIKVVAFNGAGIYSSDIIQVKRYL